MDFKQHIASIPGFPKEGIIFRDVTPLLEDKDAFKACIDDLAAHAKDLGVDIVVGPESRGFIFGCPVALELGCGFVPIRKPGKLPRETVSKKYDLEYGSNEIFMHKDSIKPGMKVLIVDDLLATGGTVEAAAALIERGGATSVTACATHAVLSGPAIERIKNSVISKVVLLDTVPVEGEKLIDKFTVLPVAPTFARAIERIYADQPFNNVFG